MLYTKKELTEKKYSIYQVCQEARRQMKGKSICVNVISGRNDAELVTLAEFNELVEQIVIDTEFYG